MNPYEATLRLEKDAGTEKSFARSRIAFYATAATTSGMMPIATVPIARFINQTYNLNSGTWVILYFIVVVLMCIPIGFASAFFARWMRRFVCYTPLVPFVFTIVFSVVPFVMISLLKGAEIWVLDTNLSTPFLDINGSVF